MEQQVKALVCVAAAVYAYFSWRADMQHPSSAPGPYFYRLMEVGSTNVPVASVFYNRNEVLLCLWSDGRIVWSTNAVKLEADGTVYPVGGAPYFEARVAPERVKAFLNTVATNEAWLKLDLKGGLFPVDSESHLMVNLEAEGWRLFLEPGIEFRNTPEDLMESYVKPPFNLGEFIGAYTNIMAGLEGLIPRTGGTNVPVRFQIVAKRLREQR